MEGGKLRKGSLARFEKNVKSFLLWMKTAPAAAVAVHAAVGILLSDYKNPQCIPVVIQKLTKAM